MNQTLDSVIDKNIHIQIKNKNQIRIQTRIHNNKAKTTDTTKSKLLRNSINYHNYSVDKFSKSNFQKRNCQVSKQHMIKLSTTGLSCIFLSFISSVCFLFSELYINPPHRKPGRGVKIRLKFYFHTCLWCLRRFQEGLKCLYKTF